MTPTRFILLLLFSFCVYLVVFSAQTQGHKPYDDERTLIAQAQDLESDPAAAWRPNYHFRRHPVYLHFLYAQSELFGMRPQGYFLTLFLLHLLNALLLMRLCRLLGMDALPAFLAALLFLYSSAFFQTLISWHGAMRPLCLLFLLLASFCWLRFLEGHRWPQLMTSCFFQVMAIWTIEDGMLFPPLALWLVWSSSRLRPVRAWAMPWLALLAAGIAALGAVIGPFMASTYASTRFSAEVPLLEKVASLGEMLLRPLLMPEKGLMADTARLIPAGVLFLLIALLLIRPERWRHAMGQMPWKIMLRAMLWIGICVLPFAGHAMSFEHASRLMYIPMVGACMLYGIVAAVIFSTAKTFFPRMGPILCAVALLALLAIQLANTSHQYHKLQAFLNYGDR